jgi:predicted AlkP superfamily phosphohydrolase/phosphomutase
MKRKAILTGILILILLGSFFLWFGESQSGSRTRVFLIGVDGASWDIIQRLASENRIPNLQKLMERGASGYLDSIPWRKKIDKSHGLFSPIIWASIATGKLPSKHGIEDFRLPLPGTTLFQMGYSAKTGPTPSSLVFPFNAHDRTTIALSARLPQGLEKSTIDVLFNLRPVGEAKLEKNFKQFRFEIQPDLVRWKDNQLMFRFYEGIQNNNNFIGADVESIRIYNAAGLEIFDYCTTRTANMFQKGWIHVTPTQLALASSFHLRTRTLWEILSAFDRRVGVVGWWASWPAYPLNGYLVSSHVGFQGERVIQAHKDFLSEIPDLAYPPELLNEVRKVYFRKEQMVPEFEKRFFKFGECGCIGSIQEKIALNYFWQDKLFTTFSTHLLENKKDIDLFAVYFRGTDTMSHQFLGFNENYELVKSECSKFPACDLDKIHNILDNYYTFLDAEIGKILKLADRRTYVFVVTDHGEFAHGRKGMHKNNGFMIAAGPGIRKSNPQKASVLDIVPSILYVMGLPVAQDMDGKILTEAFERNLLLEHPAVYVDSYDKMIRAHSKEVVVDKTIEEDQAEELKALGYIN